MLKYRQCPEPSLSNETLFFLGLADLALLITAFGLVYLINYVHLAVSGKSYNLLQLQILVWLHFKSSTFNVRF